MIKVSEIEMERGEENGEGKTEREREREDEKICVYWSLPMRLINYPRSTPLWVARSYRLIPLLPPCL